MGNERKSIIEEALLEAQEIDKAFKANAKEILSKTMSTEIEGIVKESLLDSNKALKEEEEDDEITATELEVSDNEDEMESEDEMGSEEEDEMEDETEEVEDTLDVIEPIDSEDEDEMTVGSDEVTFDNVADDEMGTMGDDEMTGDLSSDMDVVDMTPVSDEQLITVFKKMGPDDEIEVVQDGGNLNIKDNKAGTEYRVELGSSINENEESEEDEIIYEIEVDTDEEEVINLDEIGAAQGEHEGFCREFPEHNSCKGEEMEEGKYSGRRRQFKQAERRFQPKIQTESKVRFSKLIKENSELKNQVSSYEKELNEVKELNENFVKSLKDFRTKLQEVALFNSNLAHTVRLFTEHTTTKDEKMNIIKRFDECKDLKESKLTYKSILNEMTSTPKKSSIKESIDEKLNQTKTSSTLISEQSAFVNPEFEKMKKLWNFDYKY